MLHYRAAAIPHVDMGRLLADDLRLVPERLAAYLDVLSGQRVGRLAGMNILLIFDGVNEHPQARQLCEAVRDFARTCSHPWIKILVCLRSAYWEYVRDVFMADPTGLWVHRDELGATRPYVQIDQFTPGEVARAHDLYLHNRKRWKLRIQGDWEHVPETVREILRDPYLLRQYAKNYRFPPDGLVPATILMDSFGSLVPGHRAFLVRLLTLMWSRGTDILDREALGSDPKLMEYYREEPYTNGYLTRCPVHPDQGGEFLLEVPTEPPCCPSCDRRFELDPTERRNTIDALIDQGIIAVSRRDEADATVRFAHDRIFEAVSAVFLSVSHDAERLGPEQRAARLGPSLEHAQLRNALVLYQLITARYSIEDDNGVPITSPERMYLDSERLRFDERDSTLQHWNEVHAMLEHLLERDDPRLASFLVKSMAQLPKGGEWVERIFDEEKTRPPSAPLGLSFQIAAQAARELGLTGQLLGVLSWGRPFHADFALEYLFHLASGSVEQDGGAFATVLTYLRRELRGIRGLWRHRLAIKPLLELMLRIASVHVDKPAVMTTLGTLLVELLGSLPLVGRRGPRWLQPLAWLATRVLLVPASFVVVPWIKEKVEESSEKSTFLAGASAERILTLGPDDPAKIRLCLSNLGNKEPSGDPLWDLLREFDTPDRERTTVPSVKTSLCSAMELSRLLCEGESVLPRLHAHLDHVEAAHSRLTMLNLLGYYAIIQREVSADLLSLARRISTELHGRFWAEARRCRSFAGLENYPLFQLGIVEKAAGHSSMGGLQEAARRAIAQQDADTLVYAWKNMLPAAVRWPEETLGFLAATVDFQPDHILLRGTEWKLPRPTGSAPARVLPEDPLGPLRELISALNLVHRRALEGFLDRQEVDSEWRSFLLSEQRHERLRRFQTTKTTTRFVNMQLNDPESGLFREWARKVFDVWLDHAEATGFRPLGRRGLVRLTFGLLRIAQELVHSRLPR